VTGWADGTGPGRPRSLPYGFDLEVTTERLDKR
jgi:hypothetical protein